MVAAALGSMFAGTAGHATADPLSFSTEGIATGTDNNTQAVSGSERSDVILSLQPMLQMRRRSPGLDLQLDAGALLRHYTHNTQPDHTSPVLRAQAHVNLVEHLLTVDSRAELREEEADPYAARASSTSNANTRRAGDLEVAPMLQIRLSSNTDLQARESWALTRRESAGQGDLEVESHLLRLERQPTPLGAALEWSGEHARFPHHVDGGWSTEALRAEASAKVDEELQAGLIAGRERTAQTLSNRDDTVYGARLRWTPTDRTEVTGRVEHRFFGRAWEFKLQHRMPMLATQLSLVREPLVSPMSLGVAAAGQSFSNFLDAILTTRVPDPLQRAALVDALVTQRHLPASVPTALDVQADYGQLRNGATVGAMLFGRRDTLSLSAYRETLTALPGTDATLFPFLGSDSRQYGALLNFNHRLAPQSTLAFTLRWSRIEGLASRLGDRSDDGSEQLAWVQSLSPRSDWSVGLQHRRYTTNVAGLNDFTANSGFVGLKHRF
jgi:uncharacterized protein (PEP-CTERM system associated)